MKNDNIRKCAVCAADEGDFGKAIFELVLSDITVTSINKKLSVIQ